MNYANKNIQAMKPYSPPLSGRRAYAGLNLDFNERTVSTSPKVIKALKDFLENPDLQMYPEYFDLVDRIAEYVSVQPAQAMITNGADQGIDVLFRTFTKEGDRVVIPSPSFAMFYQSAGVVGNEIIELPYNDDYTYPVEGVLQEIEQGVKLVVICNPNNPTGTLVPLEDVEKILAAALKEDTVVFVDEAYADFSKLTAIPLLNKYPNLVITRTFSKAFGLCSLRIGYTISSAEMIGEMCKVRGPYDMNMLSCVAAKAALDDLESLDSYVDEVMNVGKPMLEKFFEENSIKFYPSGANFIFFAPKDRDATWESLKENGLLTRKKNGLGGEPILRMTIGTKEQVEKVMEVFTKCILN